ncbi:inorganic phosphate transporter [Acuticoccus yangtzensis]|uniref:inorganic phosphate transporter n=1 Tax=Acuticoccus yangtzensis TaxID=1443441 RepID=UPI0009497F8B|nr:inorganic phosphate transporter [Acuticoccus yangtzensis]
MPSDDSRTPFKDLDKDLGRIGSVEFAAQTVGRPLVAPAIAFAFIALAAAIASLFSGLTHTPLLIVVAAAMSAYMGLNIGANDVANNMGPAVGARVMTMGGALVLAAVSETAGALLAGGDVVGTLAEGIIAPDSVASPRLFIIAMMAGLVSSAVWVNIATFLGAPVSTTHSVVGGVLGAGLVAAGASAINWPMLGAIAASWMVSPLAGGAVAALILAFLEWRIVRKDDIIAAARVWVPASVGLMAGAFTTYIALRGLPRVVPISFLAAASAGVAAGLAAALASVPLVRRRAAGLENRKRALKTLFGLPLIIAAALLSFAHGANDVANAVGPLAAIVQVAMAGNVSADVALPFWVLILGAAGISLGLFLFGPRLIRMVGEEITKLNPVRGFCIALATAITVITASGLGIPVSTTHIAVGGVFGVGFYREWAEERRAKDKAPKEGDGEKKSKRQPAEERRRRRLVRRSHVLTIFAAWVITVPATALLSAALFVIINALD